MFITTVERNHYVHVPNEEPALQKGDIFLVQDHIVRKGEGQDLNPATLTPKPMHLGIIQYRALEKKKKDEII